MVDDRVNFCRVSGHWTRPLGRVVNGSAVSKESNRTVAVERRSWVSKRGEVKLTKSFSDSPDKARTIDRALKMMALYHFETCPYCHKVRHFLGQHALAIELRDTANDVTAKSELIAGGGRHRVPCLRIQKPDDTVEWLFESDDIIAYLKAWLSAH